MRHPRLEIGRPKADAQTLLGCRPTDRPVASDPQLKHQLLLVLDLPGDNVRALIIVQSHSQLVEKYGTFARAVERGDMIHMPIFFEDCIRRRIYIFSSVPLGLAKQVMTSSQLGPVPAGSDARVSIDRCAIAVRGRLEFRLTDLGQKFAGAFFVSQDHTISTKLGPAKSHPNCRSTASLRRPVQKWRGRDMRR